MMTTSLTYLALQLNDDHRLHCQHECHYPTTTTFVTIIACSCHSWSTTTSFTAVDAAPHLTHPTSLTTDNAAFEAVNMLPFHHCQYCPGTTVTVVDVICTPATLSVIGAAVLPYLHCHQCNWHPHSSRPPLLSTWLMLHCHHCRCWPCCSPFSTSCFIAVDSFTHSGWAPPPPWLMKQPFITYMLFFTFVNVARDLTTFFAADVPYPSSIIVNAIDAHTLYIHHCYWCNDTAPHPYR